ncbi:unnamed protein product [Spirodela intermedia]|uniref:Uncharacterized protein n=1 Tax=Spirodela intermedia TaxID=51605 RepID=A0A7I8K4M8_SPIIN|nr:unnamed protein product [Spirodela intermedia]
MGRIGKNGRGSGGGIVRLWQREVGDLNPRTFKHRVGASEDLILRLSIHNKLEKHRGCVNTVTFNTDGGILVSGSDDRMVILWDWEPGRPRLSFHSGHTNNVFQAKIMPYSDNKNLVTCAADGEVRYAQILEGGPVETKMLAKHEGRAHKMAFDPGSSHIFYSCGEDGVVQHFDLRTQFATPLFTCKSFRGRSSYLATVHLNAIAIDPRNSSLFAIAGSDEYARLYDIRKYKWDGSTDGHYPVDSFCPPHLIGDGQVGITGLAFSNCSELLVSYNDELIYLFSKEEGLGPEPGSLALEPATTRSGSGSSSAAASDIDTDFKPGPQAYSGHQNCDTVKGVNFFGPNCEYVVSGSDCGRIFIWRKKDGELLRAMEADRHVVNCIEPHPHATVLASSGLEDDIKLWTPNAIEPAPPVNLDEVLTPDGIACFALDDYDCDYTDDDCDLDDADSDSDGDLDSDDDLDSGSGGDDDDDDDDDNAIASGPATPWEEKASPGRTP